MNFQFLAPGRLVVGRGKISEIGVVAREFGTKVFLIADAFLQKEGCLTQVTNSLQQQGIQSVLFIKPAGEPDIIMTNSTVEAAVKEHCDAVVSIGGGAAIDLGKAVAGLVTNGGSVMEYMEGIGTGRQVEKPSLPHIAIPTTAGTGAEVTRNAVITAKDVQFKKSFRSPSLFPSVAILDAELSRTLPPQQTAYCGMDAITQLIESFITKKSNPVTDALALLGMEMAFASIREVYKNGMNIDAREKMLLASTLSGICLANAGLGMAHGFAAALGAMYDIPHGKACAILLPHTMRFNRKAVLQKMAAIGSRVMPGLTADSELEMADNAVIEIGLLVRALDIPADFKSYSINKTDFDAIYERSKGNSMDGNPIPITYDQAKIFLEPLL